MVYRLVSWTGAPCTPTAAPPGRSREVVCRLAHLRAIASQVLTVERRWVLNHKILQNCMSDALHERRVDSILHQNATKEFKPLPVAERAFAIAFRPDVRGLLLAGGGINPQWSTAVADVPNLLPLPAASGI